MALKRDRDGNKTSRAHVRDDNWTKFEEYARQRESVGEGNFPISSRNPLSPTSGRLHKEDMALYGREPATDHMVLAVCEICRRVVKSQAFARHREIYHPEIVKNGGASSLQRVPIRTMGQSSGVFGGVANGGGTAEVRRKALDLDRHCGVYIENDKKYCKKSISCKIHSLEQRRKVMGRSRPLSDLITEYKKLKKIRKMEKSKKDPGQTGTAPPYMSPAHPPTSVNHVPISPTSPFTPQPQAAEGMTHLDGNESPPHPSVANYFDDIEVEPLETNDTINRDNEATPTMEVGVSDIDLYPKPVAVCSFSRRVTSGRGSSSLFNHRLDTFRCSLVSLAGREKDFAEVLYKPDASTRRKYSSCLNHRTQHKRKYAQLQGDQNHFIRVESKYPPPHSAPQSATPTSPTPLSSTVTMKTSSFYNPSRRPSQQLTHNTVNSPLTTSSKSIVRLSDEMVSMEDSIVRPHPLSNQYHPKAPSIRRSSGTDEQLFKSQQPGPLPSLYNSSNNSVKQQQQNHVMESFPFPSENSSEDPFNKHQQQIGNHLDHWAESVSEATPTNLLQAMKIAPPTVNGVINSTSSHGSSSSSSGMVQPFSLHSQQTYLLNPSQQQPHLFPRGVVPIGLGVPHTPPTPSFQMGVASAAAGMSQSLPMQPPLLYPGDKPDQSLIQLMTQSKVTSSVQSQSVVGHDGGRGTVGTGGEEHTQTRGMPLHDGSGSLNNLGPPPQDQDRLVQHNQYGYPSSKQFDGLPNAHHFTENYFNEFNNTANLTSNQCLTPPTQYLLNQFGNQNSPITNSISRHSSPALALHQLTAGGLVQSSNELPSHAPPTNPSPIIPPSPLAHTQPNNPNSVHYISPSGKQAGYLNSSQTGMVSPSRGPAHRTQQRVS